ncbi:dihydrofolate reductase family protein [uncultured Ruegeria sp.]|uniref:dihydrofolate reductase family protein n=1 Tax=uncultured Ruegeria sp. TaxID=259304 RepID=UPI00261143BB|nr:dihydrofolate reductase family protein [uncultured Ruegeria sp.]
MPTGHVMMAITLDGYVARKNHSLDWLMKQDTADEDHGFAEFLDNIDVIVMGRGSFRTVFGFDVWPYEKPVVVLSHSLTSEDIPPELAGRVEVVGLSPQDLMAEMGRRGWHRIYVDGGAIVQSFLKLGLINDFKLAIVPILLGDGIRLFGDLTSDVDLELTHTKAFPSGLVELRYKVV